jgi:YggT family protein
LLILVQIYYYVVFARIIMSWFITGAVGNQLFADIYKVVYVLTEPLLAPLRKAIPMIRVGMGYLDLSPLILLILVRLVQQMIYRYIYI